jgi:hypothetical protein
MRDYIHMTQLLCMADSPAEETQCVCILTIAMLHTVPLMKVSQGISRNNASTDVSTTEHALACE